MEIARNYGVPLIVKSSWTTDPGTRVVSQPVGDRPLENLEIARPVDAIRYNTNQAQIGLLRVPDRPGIAAKLFGELAKQAVDVDLIIQSIHEGNTNDIAFTVTEQEADRVGAMAGAIAPTLRTEPTRPMETEGAEAELVVDRHVAEVSIYGAGMIGRPGVAAQMFNALAAKGINLLMITTSAIKISCVVEQDQGVEALKAVHEAFDLSGEYQASNVHGLTPAK